MLAKCCGLNWVTAMLASTLGEKEGNLRQRLREWCWEKEQKKGLQRTDWEVRQSFKPLLKWVLSLWRAEERQLALAMDATSLKDIFVVLSISVVYRGCAIPVAWAVLPEGKPGSWKEPWFILTDLPPESASAAWYAMRSWIEDCFKDFKRDGWQWQKTRMSDPARAARFWLALAVATLWVVSAGGEADASLSPSSLDHLPPSHIARTSKSRSAQPRTLSCFSRGLIVILAALLSHQTPHVGVLFPEPWPSKTYP